MSKTPESIIKQAHYAMCHHPSPDYTEDFVEAIKACEAYLSELKQKRIQNCADELYAAVSNWLHDPSLSADHIQKIVEKING